MYFCNGFYELKPNVLTISEYFLFHTNWIYEIHEIKKNKNKLMLLTIFNAVDSSDEYHFCKKNRKF